MKVPRASELYVGFGDGDFTEWQITPASHEIKLVLPSTLKASDYSSMYVELKVDNGETDLATATRSSLPAVQIVKPEFDENGKYKDNAKIVVNKTYNGVGVLKVYVIDNKGQEIYASRVVNLKMKVETADDLIAALNDKSGTSVVLGIENTITLTDFNLNVGKDVTMNFNGGSLRLKYTSKGIEAGANVISDGSSYTLCGATTSSGSYNYGTFLPYYDANITDSPDYEIFVSNGSLTIDHMSCYGSFYDSDAGYYRGCYPGLRVQGKNAKLTVSNSYMERSYMYRSCIASSAETNADGSLKYGQDATIVLENSEFNSFYGTAFVNDVPANVTIKNCRFTGGCQGALLRGGTYDISNSYFYLSSYGYEYNGSHYLYMSADDSANRHESTWGEGVRATFAALTIGNRNDNAYQYPTVVNMTKVYCSTQTDQYDDVEKNKFASCPAAYVYGNSTAENGVTITYDTNTHFIISEYENGHSYVRNSNGIEIGGGYVTINGEKVEANQQASTTTE